MDLAVNDPNSMNDVIVEYLSSCFVKLIDKMELPIETSLNWETSFELTQNIFFNIGNLVVSILKLFIYVARPVLIVLYQYLGFLFRWMKPYASFALQHTLDHLKKQDAVTLLLYVSILVGSGIILYLRSLLKRLKVQKYVNRYIKSYQKYMEEKIYRPLKKINTVAAEVLPYFLTAVFFFLTNYIFTSVLGYPSPFRIIFATLSNSSMKDVMHNLISIYYPAVSLYYKLYTFCSTDVTAIDNNIFEEETTSLMKENKSKGDRIQNKNIGSKEDGSMGSKNNNHVSKRKTLRSSLSPSRLSFLSSKATSLIFGIDNRKNIQDLNKALISSLSYWVVVALLIEFRNILSFFWLDKILAYIPLSSNYSFVFSIIPFLAGNLVNKYLIPYIASVLFAPVMTLLKTLENNLMQPMLWMIRKLEFIGEDMKEKIEKDFQGFVLTFIPCCFFILTPGFITKWGIDVITLLYPTYAILKLIQDDQLNVSIESNLTEKKKKENRTIATEANDRKATSSKSFWNNFSLFSSISSLDNGLNIRPTQSEDDTNERQFLFYYNHSERLLNWCKYWCFYAALHFFFHVVEPFIGWLWLYYHAKLVFFLYLLCPALSGHKYIENSINIFLWMMPINLDSASKTLIATIEGNRKRYEDRALPAELNKKEINQNNLKGTEELLGYNLKGEPLFGIPTPLKTSSRRRQSLESIDIDADEMNKSSKKQYKIVDFSSAESKEMHNEINEEKQKESVPFSTENGKESDINDEKQFIQTVNSLESEENEFDRNLRNRKSRRRTLN